jgi:hypothetical protein
MKTTEYARKLLALCRKMNARRWELRGRRIRLDEPCVEHCPLSACGGAPDVRRYRSAGHALGFTDDQIDSITLASDDPIGGGLVAASQERRILLKAARLWVPKAAPGNEIK